MEADLASFTESQIRLGFFLGVLVIIATWEVFRPRRKQLFSRAARWPSNIGIVVLNTLILRIIFPTAAVGVAEYASANQLGVFNQFDFGVSFEIIIAVLVLDAAIYFQHVMFHALPLFWRLHRMHHADPDFDVTTRPLSSCRNNFVHADQVCSHYFPRACCNCSHII